MIGYEDQATRFMQGTDESALEKSTPLFELQLPDRTSPSDKILSVILSFDSTAASSLFHSLARLVCSIDALQCPHSIPSDVYFDKYK